MPLGAFSARKTIPPSACAIVGYELEMHSRRLPLVLLFLTAARAQDRKPVFPDADCAQAVKDIHLHPLVRDARQRLLPFLLRLRLAPPSLDGDCQLEGWGGVDGLGG